MSTIKNLAIERTTANDSDYFVAQDPSSNATYKITKQNLFTGISASGGGGRGFLSPGNIFIANYQNDFSDLKGHPPTIIGSPAISADKSPFPGGKSLYLPGNSYLAYQHASDFNLSADYMIECFAWIPSAYANNNTYAGLVNIQDLGCVVTIGLLRSGYSNNGVTKQVYFQTYSSGQNISAICYTISSITFDTWNYFAALKIGNTMYLGLNGVFQTSALIPALPRFINPPATITIGLLETIPPMTNGYIAGVRVRSTFIKTPTLPFTLTD